METKLDKDLHQAAATGSSKLLQKILDTGKVHIDCRDEVSHAIGYFTGFSTPFFSVQEGITPLMLATANNRLNCVKILLQEGAEPNIKSKVRSKVQCRFYRIASEAESSVLG